VCAGLILIAENRVTSRAPKWKGCKQGVADCASECGFTPAFVQGHLIAIPSRRGGNLIFLKLLRPPRSAAVVAKKTPRYFTRPRDSLVTRAMKKMRRVVHTLSKFANAERRKLRLDDFKLNFILFQTLANYLLFVLKYPFLNK